ncbi:BTB domain-containing protein [Aphelenchoides bicaudatus]|nr:BTB domain-containing protein [Aphelenchoides bicaudatus]
MFYEEELEYCDVLKKGYQNGSELCDVEIKVNKTTFSKASKYMLCVHSPIFKAMFTNDTEEKRTNTIEINKFGADVINDFLLYLHTGFQPENTEQRAKLFSIADYYCVESLRKYSLEALNLTLNSENASEYYDLAKQFRLDGLKDNALANIKAHMECSNLFWYFDFATKRNYMEISSAVVQYIHDNLLEVANTTAWKQLDETVRLEIFQRQIENFPSKSALINNEFCLSVKLIGPRVNDMCTDIASEPVKCYTRKLKFINTGTHRLVYTICPTKADPVFQIKPSNFGVVGPGEDVDLDIRHLNDEVVVLYKKKSAVFVEHSFQNGELCFQQTITL